MIDFLIFLCIGLFVVITGFLCLIPAINRNVESSNYMVEIQRAKQRHRLKLIEQEEAINEAMGMIYGRNSSEY